MSQLALMISRLAASAWVGAAVLFVATGVRQVTSGLFSATTTDQLVLLRFPLYYICGCSLITVAIVGTTLARAALGRGQRAFSMVCLGLALLLMFFDYMVIYSPLAAMISPPGQSRGLGFQTLHRASMGINLVDLLLVAVAAGTLCWPRRTEIVVSREING